MLQNNQKILILSNVFVETYKLSKLYTLFEHSSPVTLVTLKRHESRGL